MLKEEKETQLREEARQRGAKREEEARSRAEDARRREQEQKKRVEDILRRRARAPLWLRYGPYAAYGLLAALTLFLLFNALSGGRRSQGYLFINDDARFRRHNEEKHPYTLGRNTFFESVTLNRVKELTDNKLTSQQRIAQCNAQPLAGVTARDSFNFYTEHPQCRFEETQQKCSGAYAEVPLSVFRNRHCLVRRGRDFRPSVDFAFACSRVGAQGCRGGHVLSTVKLLQKGVVSDACWRQRIGADRPSDCPTSRLEGCAKRGVNVHCLLRGEDQIKKEVQQNGPVVALMAVHRDFLSYRDGVFLPDEEGKLPGLIAVKIVGWESDSLGGGAWLVDPLWGSDWGRGGVGRVAMGAPESLLERSAYTFYVADDAEEQPPKAPEASEAVNEQ